MAATTARPLPGLPARFSTGRKLIAAASVMPADYRGTIRHARRWVEMCARDMPHLDVHYVTREGKIVLSGLEQAFLDSDGRRAPTISSIRRIAVDPGEAPARSVIMDGHGGDYTLHPRGQAALARLLATFRLRRFVTELRGHLRMTGTSLWTTLKLDIAALLLPRICHGVVAARPARLGAGLARPADQSGLRRASDRARRASREQLTHRGQAENRYAQANDRDLRRMTAAPRPVWLQGRAAWLGADAPVSRQARGRAGAGDPAGALCQERPQPLRRLRCAERHLSARISDALAQERRRNSGLSAHGEIDRAAIAGRDRAHGEIGSSFAL